MGLDSLAIQFLLEMRKQEVRFQSTLTLGRQELTVNRQANKLAVDIVGNEIDINAVSAAAESLEQKYADAMFADLGAGVVDSIDIHDAEGATICHDLNLPIPTELHTKYSVVIDGGTLEHIYNLPSAIRQRREKGFGKPDF